MEKNLTDKNEKWLEWAVELQSLDPGRPALREGPV